MDGVKLQKEQNSIVDPVFKRLYQSMIRSLMYLSTVSCPDIAFAAGVVTRYNANPNQSHMDAVHRIYAYIRDTLNTGLHYPKSHQNLQLVGYVDSDHAGCEDTK